MATLPAPQAPAEPVTAAEVIDIEPADSRRLANLCGPLDRHLRQVEERLNVKIAYRGNLFAVHGAPEARQRAARFLDELYAATGRETLDPAVVNLYLGGLVAAPGPAPAAGDEAGDNPVIRTRRGPIRGRGAHQIAYIRSIRNNDVNFGVGPAGTGKTYLAVACAVDALEHERVARIVLVRPAVEAGERLGFLPGDMAQKVDPYLRPLYDALYEMLGHEQVARLIDRHVIEIAPLAFMRGRTLNDAFIILDEAQNTTSEQMKMFLTRIGFASKAVITGDLTQTDLPSHRASGLPQALALLAGVPGIGITRFDAGDVVRHQLVQRIIEAYEKTPPPAEPAAR